MRFSSRFALRQLHPRSHFPRCVVRWFAPAALSGRQHLALVCCSPSFGLRFFPLPFPERKVGAFLAKIIGNVEREAGFPPSRQNIPPSSSIIAPPREIVNTAPADRGACFLPSARFTVTSRRTRQRAASTPLRLCLPDAADFPGSGVASTSIV